MTMLALRTVLNPDLMTMLALRTALNPSLTLTLVLSIVLPFPFRSVRQLDYRQLLKELRTKAPPRGVSMTRYVFLTINPLDMY